MNNKLYQDLLEIKTDLIIDNKKINKKIKLLYAQKKELEKAVQKINSLNNIINQQDKVDSIIISSLINTLAIIYEIITIGSDNGITKNNIQTVCMIPLISSGLTYASFFNYNKNKKFIANNPLSKIETQLTITNNQINDLINRKITNQKILNNIEINLRNNNQKTLVKALNMHNK